MSLATIKPFKAAPTLPGTYGSQVYKNTLGLPASTVGSAYTPDYSSILSALPKAGNPAAKVAAPSANVSGTAANGIDYQKLLADDPTLQAQLAGVNAQGTANQAALTAARQRALAQYGEIPASLSGTLTGDVNADIDQTTRDLAGEATKGGVSTVAQLRHAYDLANESHLNSLAARGMLHSGALGQHGQEDLDAYQRAGYGANQSLLDYLTGIYQNYLGLQSQGQASAADVTNQALQRIIAQINAGLIGGKPAAAPTDKSLTPPPPNPPASPDTIRQVEAILGGAPTSPADLTPELAQELQRQATQTNPVTGDTFVPPEYGEFAGYSPAGAYVSGPQTLAAETYSPYEGLLSPGGGVYRSGGGAVTYQSGKGKYGKKPLR